MLSAAVAIIAVSCTDAHVSLVWGDTSDRYPQDAVDEIVEKTPFAYPVWKGEKACAQAGMELYLPPLSLCGDNGAMIGCQAYYEYLAGKRGGLNLNAYANLEI